MKIEDRLKGYRILEEPTAREEKIMETVRASQNAFFEREQEQQLSRWEFLWIQMKFIRKNGGRFRLCCWQVSGVCCSLTRARKTVKFRDRSWVSRRRCLPS